MSRIKQDRYYFSHIFENRISFNSHLRNMTYEYYLKQTKSMCELKMNEIVARNPKIINCLNRNSLHTLIRKYSNIPFKSQKKISSTAQKCANDFVLTTINFK